MLIEGNNFCRATNDSIGSGAETNKLSNDHDIVSKYSSKAVLKASSKWNLQLFYF